MTTERKYPSAVEWKQGESGPAHSLGHGSHDARCEMIEHGHWIKDCNSAQYLARCTRLYRLLEERIAELRAEVAGKGMGMGGMSQREAREKMVELESLQAAMWAEEEP